MRRGELGRGYGREDARPRSGAAARALLLTLACACPVVSAPAPEAAAAEAPTAPPVVVVSVLPMAWFVEQLADGDVSVQVMLPPGANPTTYEPSLRELRAVERARLALVLDDPHFPFEGTWLTPLREARSDLPVLALGRAPGSGGDPHVWLSPEWARRLVARLEPALAALLPSRAAVLGDRRAALEREIDAVDAELRGRLGPLRGRRFAVFHPSWGSLAADYGLVQWPIERDGKTPGALELARLIRDARAAGVRELLVQPQFDDAPARVVADAIGARLVVLDPLAYDWSENLRSAGRAIAEAAVP